MCGAGSSTPAVPVPPVLQVRSVNVQFNTAGGWLTAVQDFDLDIAPGDRIGLVGESGSGKTVTGLALMGLLPARTSRVSGSVRFDGQDLQRLPESARRRYRGRKLAMIFQEPMSALDPLFSIGEQISETLLAHFPLTRRAARAQAVDLLESVGIPSPRQRAADYPHQLSGGMRQRAMIAIALACEPAVLIADEPTTALDVTVQAQIVDLLLRLCADRGTALLMITHDLGLVAETCARLVTMYAGQAVEEADIDAVLHRPLHPYSSALLRSIPSLSPPKTRLPAIPGRVPGLAAMPTGCRFAARCGFAQPACVAEEQLLTPAGAGRRVRCGRHAELALPGAVA
jgi:peptide/nickel transport system ATP-binding protein